MQLGVINPGPVGSNAGSSSKSKPAQKLMQAAARSARAPNHVRSNGQRRWMIWAASLGIWTFIALAATLDVIPLYQAEGGHLDFREAAYMQFSQMLPFVPLTPLVFVMVARYPLRRENWIRLSALYLVAGLVFTAAHVGMRGFTPFGVWDRKARAWHSAAWDYETHRFRVQWRVFKNMLVQSVFDDVISTYIPIVFLAYVVSYYSTLKDRERLTAQLEAQLARANLQALKSQLQPHFLFNTMHSISGLMFTDVRAADKMMARLSELLRMSLEGGAEQITTLNRELEFVNGYLEIEKMRFGERLAVDLNVSPETLDAQVPHLLLQPLVENAIQHGIAKLSSKGEITIASRQDGPSLWLTISDNGPGFDGIDRSIRKAGLGIGTSRERLQTLYGDNQNLSFRLRPQGGTQVTIRIPFRLTIHADADRDIDGSKHLDAGHHLGRRVAGERQIAPDAGF